MKPIHTMTWLWAAGCLAAGAAYAQEYALSWQAPTAGGGASTGGIYAVQAVLGETFTGKAAADGFAVDAGLHAALAEPELILNGSFEDLAGTFVSDGFGAMSLAPGADVIPGWTVANAEIAWLGNGNPFGPATIYGGFFLDLSGYHDTPPYGAVTQAVPTSPGQEYRLGFSLGVDQDVSFFRGPVSVGVAAGAVSNVFVLAPAAEATGNLWETFSLDFTASETATLLSFAGLSTTGGAYIGLDNVSLQALSVFRITQLARLGDDLQLTFSAQPGATYEILASPDPASGNWQPEPGTTVIATGNSAGVTLTNAVFQPQRFYRVHRLP